jgi:hypothetical protein
MAQPGFVLCGFGGNDEDYLPFAASLSTDFPPVTPVDANWRGVELSLQDMFDLVFQVRKSRMYVDTAAGGEAWFGDGEFDMLENSGETAPADETEILAKSCQRCEATMPLISSPSADEALTTTTVLVSDYTYSTLFSPGTRVRFTFGGAGSLSTDPADITNPVVSACVVTIYGQVVTAYEESTGDAITGTIDVEIDELWPYNP